MTTPFEDALALAPEAARKAVGATLAGWRAGAREWQRIAANIERETALEVGALVGLITDFADAIAAGGAATDAWISVCRTRHQFQGRRLPDPIPVRLGRAVPLGTQADVLQAGPVPITRDVARALLRRVALQGTAVHPRDAALLRSAPLGRYVLWATFCASHPAECPFQHLPRGPGDIRTALGLGQCAPGVELVLLSYEVSGKHAALALHRPTIGDAEGYAWYSPHSDPTSGHGLTEPLPPNPDRILPQPEVVHRAIDGSTLVFPLYVAI